MKKVYEKLSTDQLTSVIASSAHKELIALADLFGEFVEDNLDDMFDDFVWNTTVDEGAGIQFLQHLYSSWGFTIKPTGWTVCKGLPVEEEQSDSSGEVICS